MPLQIFVEDQLTDAYERLALRALGLPTTPRNRRQVQASRIEVDELTSRGDLLDLTERSVRSGYDCVLFVMDEEGLPRSPERPAKLASFRRAFQELCDHLSGLRGRDPLQHVKVSRIVCKRCLESWLAADPQAIVDFARGRHGLDYRPALQNTENLLPKEASERIVQIIREVGRRIERRDLATLGSRGAKSLGKEIASHVLPERARSYNYSLAYFYDMAAGHRSGCDHPFPDSE
jgi:hypothetical protein